MAFLNVQPYHDPELQNDEALSFDQQLLCERKDDPHQGCDYFQHLRPQTTRAS
jgi:hypothetical protein